MTDKRGKKNEQTWFLNTLDVLYKHCSKLQWDYEEVFTELPPLPDSTTSWSSKQVSKGKPASKVAHHLSTLNI